MNDQTKLHIKQEMASKLPSPPAQPFIGESAIDSTKAWHVPTDEECFALWDKYEMLDNIRAHSLKVAQVATWVAKKAAKNAPHINPQTVRASALLHDISKTYSIKYGGNHSQIGAVWTLKETGNPAIAQGVYHHVFWPFPVDITKYFLPLCVLYADKRVAHDTIVDLNSRFLDLLDRYGKTEGIRQRITVTHEQVLEVEDALQILTGEDIHENSFDCGRLVD